MRFGVFQENSGVAASSESPSLKSRTDAARSRSRRRTISANLVFADDRLQGGPANGRSFGSAVSWIHASPLNAVKPADVALTSDAAQVAGLGRILFEGCAFCLFQLEWAGRPLRQPAGRRRYGDASLLSFAFYSL